MPRTALKVAALLVVVALAYRAYAGRGADDEEIEAASADVAAAAEA